MTGVAHFKITSSPPIRDLLGRFSKAEGAFVEVRRDEMRTEGRRFFELAGEEAPGGPGHTVAKQIGYRTFVKNNSIGFTAWPGKIGAWHISGTGIYGPRGQLIRPIHAKALRFVIGGEVLYRMWVRGIRPNKFFGRAYRRWLPGARMALKRMAMKWVREIKSAGTESKVVSGISNVR